jgi:hypothetical protein
VRFSPAKAFPRGSAVDSAQNRPGAFWEGIFPEAEGEGVGCKSVERDLCRPDRGASRSATVPAWLIYRSGSFESRQAMWLFSHSTHGNRQLTHHSKQLVLRTRNLPQPGCPHLWKAANDVGSPRT